MIIRPETTKDISRINEIIQSAFKAHPYSNQKEHLLLADLRINHALSLSLVAELNNIVVGHIAFSKVTINNQDLNWYGLAPVSVDPDYQNQGVGCALIKTGLEKLKNVNAKGCVLLGEPEYYNRFGFKQDVDLILADVPAEYFLALSFVNQTTPSGEVKYNPVFDLYG